MLKFFISIHVSNMPKGLSVSIMHDLEPPLKERGRITKGLELTETRVSSRKHPSKRTSKALTEPCPGNTQGELWSER